MAPSTNTSRSIGQDIVTRDFIPKDTRIVHTTGNETISGTKTFNNQILGTISYKDTRLLKNSDVSNAAYVTFAAIRDNDNDYVNEIYSTRETNGSTCTTIRTWSKDRSSGTSTVNVWYDWINKCGYTTLQLYKDIKMMCPTFTRGTTPSSAQWWSFKGTGKDNNYVGGMWYSIDTSGYSEISFRCVQNVSTYAYKSFWLGVGADGGSKCGMNASVFRPTMGTFSTLGSSGDGRWGQIYSTVSTISTSDERKKQDILEIPDEILDTWEDTKFYQYRMKDSVKEKGSNARYHTGMIAQRIKSLFDDKNQDISRYGLFCYDEWNASDARYDEKGNETEPAVEAGNEYSIRYEELLCLEAAYQRRKNKQLEERIATLESQLASVLNILQSLKK